MPFLHHIVCRSQGELSIFPPRQEGRHHGGHVVVANSVINLEDFSCKYFAQTCLTTADSGEELIVHNTIRSWTAQNLSITSCKTFNWVSNTEMQNLYIRCHLMQCGDTPTNRRWNTATYLPHLRVLGVIGDVLAVVMYSSLGRGGGHGGGASRTVFYYHLWWIVLTNTRQDIAVIDSWTGQQDGNTSLRMGGSIWWSLVPSL